MTSTRAWLALLRPPNFLTVPGDVLAGFFLAAGAGTASFIPGLWLVLVAAVFFYAAGLLLNDWADVEVDQVERPDRPLPSQSVSRRLVLAVAASLLLAGVGLCALRGGSVLLVGIALAVAIVNYNLFTKNVPVLGPLSMGMCRGLNFLLGATFAAGLMLPYLSWWGGATLVCYIMAVTHLARREMIGRYFALERWLPALVLVGAFFVYLPLSDLVYWPAQVAVALFFLAAVLGAARTATTLPNRQGQPANPRIGSPVPTPALIGRLIALLLPLQSAMIVGSGDGSLPLVLALGVVALWPVKRWMGKRFYSS